MYISFFAGKILKDFWTGFLDCTQKYRKAKYCLYIVDFYFLGRLQINFEIVVEDPPTKHMNFMTQMGALTSWVEIGPSEVCATSGAT